MIDTKKKFKISIDLMGGDNSPDKTLEGIDLFIKRYTNVKPNINNYFCHTDLLQEDIIRNITKLTYTTATTYGTLNCKEENP